MNAKKIKNADTKTMGNKAQRPILNRNGVASGQSDKRSRADNSGTEELLADTSKSKTAKAKTRRTKKKKLTKLEELRAKSPFKTVNERKGRGRKGSASSFGQNTAINRKLNQERADCRSIEFQLQRTFGI